LQGFIPVVATMKGTDLPRGVTRGGKGGEIPRAPNHYGSAKKSLQYQKYFLQQQICFRKKPQVRTWGRQTCFLSRAPSNLVTLQV